MNAPCSGPGTQIGSPLRIRANRTGKGASLRELRIAAPAQLRLETGQEIRGSWEDLPAATQAEVLGLLSGLIAKGVVEEEGGDA